MNNQRQWWGACGWVAVLALAGCSNGHDDDSPEPPPAASTEVPASAGASPAAFIGYIQGLGVGDESSEPLTLDPAFAVPADETADPILLG